MCTRIISPFPDGKTGFPFEMAPKGQLSGMVLQSEMVGMLNMLSVLSDYTNEVFSSILKESAGIASRIASVGERCASLSLKVEAEAYVSKRPADAFINAPKAEYHATEGFAHRLFTPSSTPSHVRKQYEACNAPPKLSLLDPFVEPGQECMKNYSDPNFFVEQWIGEQKRRQEEARQYRRERKVERENRRRKRQEEEEVRVPQESTIRGVTTYVYNKDTGEKQAVTNAQRTVRRATLRRGPLVPSTTPVPPRNDIPQVPNSKSSPVSNSFSNMNPNSNSNFGGNPEMLLRRQSSRQENLNTRVQNPVPNLREQVVPSHNLRQAYSVPNLPTPVQFTSSNLDNNNNNNNNNNFFDPNNNNNNNYSGVTGARNSTQFSAAHNPPTKIGAPSDQTTRTLPQPIPLPKVATPLPPPPPPAPVTSTITQTTPSVSFAQQITNAQKGLKPSTEKTKPPVPIRNPLLDLLINVYVANHPEDDESGDDDDDSDSYDWSDDDDYIMHA